MFAAAARLTGLLGGDIDREYCMKLWDQYPKTSEPELLAGYTKVRTDATAPPARCGSAAASPPPLLTRACGMAVLVRPLHAGQPKLPRAAGQSGGQRAARVTTADEPLVARDTQLEC